MPVKHYSSASVYMDFLKNVCGVKDDVLLKINRWYYKTHMARSLPSSIRLQKVLFIPHSSFTKRNFLILAEYEGIYKSFHAYCLQAGV